MLIPWRQVVGKNLRDAFLRDIVRLGIQNPDVPDGNTGLILLIPMILISPFFQFLHSNVFIHWSSLLDSSQIFFFWFVFVFFIENIVSHLVCRWCSSSRSSGSTIWSISILWILRLLPGSSLILEVKLKLLLYGIPDPPCVGCVGIVFAITTGYDQVCTTTKMQGFWCFHIEVWTRSKNKLGWGIFISQYQSYQK